MREALNRLAAQCRADYEANLDDAFYSVLYHAKLETLERLAVQLEELGPEALLARLREERPAAEAELAQEEARPTFDWYDEHYHEKRLRGELDARQAVEKLLAEQTPC